MGSSDILNMFDEGEPRRSMRRRRVMLSARLSTSRDSVEVRIRDVSATGARIEGADLPQPGATVLLRRGIFSAAGRLVWVNGDVGGILFDDALDEDELMETLKGLPAAPPAAEIYRRPGLGRSAHGRYSDGRGWLERPPPRN